MENFQLTDGASLKTISFKINDNEEMVHFYKNIVQFVLKSEENGLAIFNLDKRKESAVILEESEAGVSLKKKHSAVHFSVEVSSEEELTSLVQRLEANGYPISREMKDAERQSIFLEDPEKNEIEFYYQDKPENEKEAAENRRVERSAELSDSDSETISESTEELNLSHVYVNTRNYANSENFYKGILGMRSIGANQLTFGDQRTVFHLYEPGSVAEADLGWSVFTVSLKEMKEMDALKEQLEKNNQEFFIDNKRTILTFFDINGIEWWFTRS